MKLTRWAVPAILAGGVLWGVRGGCLDDAQAPDQELAGHLGELCEIARDHISAPEKGVRKLGRYLGNHADDMFGDFGGTLAIIERIDDDRKHDDRARVARDRIHKPLRACERDWQRFAQAVEADPKGERARRALRPPRRAHVRDHLLGEGRRAARPAGTAAAPLRLAFLAAPS